MLRFVLVCMLYLNFNFLGMVSTIILLNKFLDDCVTRADKFR